MSIGKCCLIGMFILGSTASSWAGECRVKEPTEAAIADALKMATILDIQMTEVARLYRAQTGRELKVALVARAGQDLRDVVPLRENGRGGHDLPLETIVRQAEASVPFNEGGIGIDRNKVKSVIRDEFRDPVKRAVYSHLGVILWNHPDGRGANGKPESWWFRHMLRPCISKEEIGKGIDPNKPELYDEGTARFFADDPYELRAQIIVLAPELQDNLERLVLNNKAAKTFNGGFYNAAANWQNKKEANSNQWVLELLAAASRPLGQVTTRQQAQAVLRMTDYRPMRALLYGQQAMAALPFATKFAPYVRVHYDEQPFYQDYGVAELITTNSVDDWLARNRWKMFDRHIYIPEKTSLPNVR